MDIVGLASIIGSGVAEIDDYLKAQNLAQPSLDVDAPPTLLLPPHLIKAKMAIMVAMDDLKAHILGPLENLVDLLNVNMSVMPALDVCSQYQIAQKVEVGDEITYEALAGKCGLDRADLRRVMRMLIAKRIFSEPRQGVIAHNGSSKLLHDRPQLANWLGYSTQTIWGSGFFTAKAMQKWPGGEEPDQTAFYLKQGRTFWDYANRDQVGATQFAAAMDFLKNNPIFGDHHLVSGLQWNEAEAPKLLVDVGGHNGSIATAILRKYPTVKGIVQDIPEVIAVSSAPEDVRGRLDFQVHDFFTPQPVQADAYLLRSILHDWPDKYAQKIITSLIPALKPGARVIINEICMPDPGRVPKSQEAILRGYDLCMKQFFNSKERDLEEWIGLFKSCDERFQLARIEVPPASALAVIEFVWNMNDVP